MRKPRYKNACAALLICTTALAPVQQASASNFLDAMFDGMWVATTDPAFVETQTRGALIGGSITARIPTRPISVFAVDPPRLSAGCGGIDLFGGSFSFIDSDQLIAILRTIGQQAKALLFKLAIDAINKQLGGLITEFAEKIQAMNEMMKNTCSIAQGAVDLVTPDSWKVALEGKQRSFSEKWNTAVGEGKDLFESTTKSFTEWNWSKNPSKNSAIASGKDPNMYNLVWRQLWASNVLQEIAQGSSIGENKGVTAVLVMNITGTTIMKPEDSSSSNCGSDPQCSQQSVEQPVTLSIDALRNPGDMKVRVCTDQPIPSMSGMSGWLSSVDAVTGCTEMEPQLLSRIYPGTDQFVNEAMFGVAKATMTDAEYSGANGGLVGYLKDPVNVTLSARSKGMLAKTDIPMLGYLRKVQRDPSAIDYVAKQIVPLVAEDEAIKLMSALTRAGRQAYADGAQKTTMPGNYLQNLQIAEQELHARRGSISQRIQTIAELNKYVAAVVESLPAGANAFAAN